MKRFVFVAVVVVAALAAAFRPAETSALGVVDVSRLVFKHKAMLVETQKLDDFSRVSEQMLQDRDKALKTEAGGLDSLRPESEEFRRRMKELKVKQFELEQEAKLLSEEIGRRHAKALKEAHARVRAACQQYVDSRNLDLLLQYSSTPAGGDAPGDVRIEIAVRSVLAFRKPLDVTDAVLALLDQ